MVFDRGDLVEVSSKEDGFLGSYYEATIIMPVEKNQYLVEYKTLLTDDETKLLREIIDASEVRPLPPEIQVSGFRLFDQVDAFDNDGWWVGKISGRNLTNYLVCFDTTGDKIGYPMSKLRVHQEWEDGKWLS